MKIASSGSADFLTTAFLFFFGFGVTGFHNIYLISIFGSAIALLLVTVLYVPVSNWLMKLFKGINFKWLPKPKKNKKAVVKKSAEPEEAIFIGIND